MNLLQISGVSLALVTLMILTAFLAYAKNRISLGWKNTWVLCLSIAQVVLLVAVAFLAKPKGIPAILVYLALAGVINWAFRGLLRKTLCGNTPSRQINS